MDTPAYVGMKSRPVKRALWFLLLLLFCGLAFTVRCWNLRDVFIDGRIYFLDPDCYSRMTRAALIADGGALIIRHHDFENAPEGITPHTTAPLDWLIVGGKWIADRGMRIVDRENASVLRNQTLDLAGALISPLLGALTCGWIAVWARSAARHSSVVARHSALAAPLFFAISPIAVHGTVLGRPDHQSLIVLLLTIFISAEVRLMQTVREWESHLRLLDRQVAKWSLIGGLAGGLAMWVSLYEPLVLFAVIFALLAALDREQFRWRERWWGWAAAVAVYGASLLVDGWRISLPDETARTYFPAWSRTIGELGHLDLALLWRWCGWAAAVAPVTLGVAIWLKVRLSRAGGAHPAYRPAAFLLGLLLITFGLTCWQLRWGYFFALVFAMSLPWQFAAARRPWLAWPLFIVSLYPVAQDWDARLFPDDAAQQRQAVQRAERTALRQTVGAMAGDSGGIFIAPWWQSPAIAYWTRHPGVAGSSHQSLPGIVDTARFYLAENLADAAAILKKRGVAWVLADDAERTTDTSAALFGIEPPAMPLALILAEHPRKAPPYLREIPLPPAAGNRVFYRLYSVDREMVAR